MAYQFGNTQSATIANPPAWQGSGQTVYRAYVDTGPVVKMDVLGSQGWVVSSSGNIVDNTSSNPNVIPLNEPLVVDSVSGKVHLLYVNNSDAGSAPPVLLHKSSSNSGVTWSAVHTLDDGTIHSNNSFYRVGVAAYNDYLTVVYAAEANSTLTTDGLYEVHSADAGATWSSPAKLYASPVCPFEPNMYLGDDATAHISWYDPGVVANQGGDIYYSSGAFNGTGWTWAGSATKVTNGETWGRPRIFGSNGIILIVGNTNWGGQVADVGLLRSANNGSTWGTTKTLALHTGRGTGTNAQPTSHPWGHLESDLGMIVWLLATSPQTYFAIITSDAGLTWSAPPITPFTSGSSNGDAPALFATTDLITAIGYDDSVGHSIWNSYPLFSPQPAITAAIDLFNRANENPLSDGGNWTLIGGGDNLKLVSNSIQRQGPSGSFDRAGDNRTDFTVGSSFETYLTCSTSGGTDDGTIELWLITSGNNGYNVVIGINGANLNFYTGGAYSSTPVQDSVTVITTNDRYSLCLDANCVVARRFNSSTGYWMELFRWNDTTYRASLLAAIESTGFTDIHQMDTFGGGQLFAPVNNTLPAALGTVANGQTLTSTEGIWATGLGKEPTRFSYQWQQSTDGRQTWSDISLGTLKFYTIGTASGDYRVKVTGKNSFGSTVATSAAVLQAELLVKN